MNTINITVNINDEDAIQRARSALGALLDVKSCEAPGKPREIPEPLADMMNIVPNGASTAALSAPAAPIVPAPAPVAPVAEPAPLVTAPPAVGTIPASAPPALAPPAPAPAPIATASAMTTPTSAPSAPAGGSFEQLKQAAGVGNVAPPAPVPADPPSACTATVELDSDGLPWDARIHQDTRGRMSVSGVKNAGGWKVKKTPAGYTTKEAWLQYVEQVKAELRTAMSGAPAAPAPVAASAPATPATGNAAAPASGHNFASLIAACTARGITQAQIAEAASQASGGAVASVPLLGPRADLIPAVAAALGV